MSELNWSPAVEPTPAEDAIMERLKRTGKLFKFLRLCRHQLFDDEFQAELATMYADEPFATPPVPPAMLAMVTLLQAYEGASDASAVENSVFDRRWQLALDCADCEKPPFSQGVLVSFRYRLIEHDMDRRLLERTVELARETRGFGHSALRIALDSAPLWGAGRVEDTFNLIGHTMEIVADCAAHAAGLSPKQLRAAAKTELLGHSSIKAALDIDWDDKVAQQDALARLLRDVERLRAWIKSRISEKAKASPLREALALLDRLIKQDIEPDPDRGGHRIRRGTAPNRRISVFDGEMRHGRKSKSRTINGFKRHIATELDSGLIVAATVRPANDREYAADEAIRLDVKRLGQVSELHIDRGYLAGEWVRQLHESGICVVSKPWASNTDRFSKADFEFDFGAETVSCPGGAIAPIRRTSPKNPERATFSSSTCRGCERRSECLAPTKKGGRSLVLHPQEPLLVELRSLKRTPEGRKRQRERVAVEHRLAHVCRRQGRRARYIGVRKNTFDVRRVSAVENLFAIFREAA